MKASQIKVQLSDRREFTARLVGPEIAVAVDDAPQIVRVLDGRQDIDEQFAVRGEE